jgi:AraC-like DNA-binding protein
MSAFSFNTVEPHSLLAPYVAKMYVFESNGRLPIQERKLIVPNGNFKLTLTCRNGIAAHISDRIFLQNENEISLTGLIDTPVFLNPTEDVQTGTIIIEFNPLGAYRLFRLSYSEVNNRIISLEDMIGKGAAALQSQLADADNLALKLQILESFLIKQLDKASPDPIFDYCVNSISYSQGLVSVVDLEKKTGYSSRYLHKKFTENLGTGPKNFAEIVRFRQFYQAYSTGADPHKLKSLIYQSYYDQSHFLRAFKRFTGSTPTDLQNSINELANRHYRS